MSDVVHFARRVEPERLTENHRAALAILCRSQGPITPTSTRAFRTALHELWSFGLARRLFRRGAVTYEATIVGRLTWRALT